MEAASAKLNVCEVMAIMELREERLVGLYAHGVRNELIDILPQLKALLDAIPQSPSLLDEE